MYVSGNPYPPFASVASDYELVGGIYEYVSLSEEDYIIIIYEISDLLFSMDYSLSLSTKSILIDGQQFWELSHVENSRHDMFDRYIYHKDLENLFNYETAAEISSVYISGENTERVNIFDLPFVMADEVKYYVQIINIDLNGDGRLENIAIYYQVGQRLTDEYINSIRIMVENELRQDTLVFFTRGSHSDSAHFIDLNDDEQLTINFTNEYGGSIITYTDEEGLKFNSILGELISWQDGRIYTSYNHILDSDNTVLSYFDIERGLIPFESEDVVGREITFPFGIVLLKEQDVSHNASMFFPWSLEDSSTLQWRLPVNSDNVLAEIPENERMTIVDFEYILREDRYEVFPWVKVETSEGLQGWIRIIDN
jgi:hypothetical protein